MAKNVKIQWENKSVGHTDQKIFRKLDDGDETLIATLAPTVREYTDVIDLATTPATTAIYRAMSGYTFGPSVYMEYSEYLTMDLTDAPVANTPMVITTADGALTINAADPFRVFDQTTSTELLSTPGSSIWGLPTHVITLDGTSVATTLEISSIDPSQSIGACMMTGAVRTIESWASAGHRAEPATPENIPFTFLLFSSTLTHVPTTLHPSITNLNYMFYGSTSIESDITGWDVSKVTSMLATFKDATNFNQDLSQWCVPNILATPANFSDASALTPEHFPVWGTCPRGENQV